MKWRSLATAVVAVSWIVLADCLTRDDVKALLCTCGFASHLLIESYGSTDHGQETIPKES